MEVKIKGVILRSLKTLARIAFRGIARSKNAHNGVMII